MVLNDKVRLTVLRFIRIYVCCTKDVNGYGVHSAISSRQKLMNMMKNGESTCHNGSASDSNSSAMSTFHRKKGEFIEKTQPHSTSKYQTLLYQKKKESKFF